MRTYPIWRDSDSLIVTKWTQFHDLISDTSIRVSSVRFDTYTNPLAVTCLDFLEEHDIAYIVAGSNNEDVAIYNHWKRFIVHNKEKYYSSWTYRINKISHHDAVIFNAEITKYPYYSVFKWRDFYDLLLSTEKWWYILEKDIVKIKPSLKKTLSSLTREEKLILWHIKIYAWRIRTLSNDLEITKEWMAELELYNDVDQYKAVRIMDLLDKDYLGTMEKLKELVKWKTGYKQVINDFIL